ncbi:ABC transporter permease [Clostridium sp.]|uniref:ABC transporter permease n=1 Tax=Clostridium sp. TaxID=1506 RepID=UPI002626F5E0|nr:ABC transporter permease [Clostridium sp.]
MFKKLGLLALTVVLSLLLTFLIIEGMPGNPVEVMADTYVRTEGLTYDVAYERAKMTLNYDPKTPLHERFSKYLKGIVTGDLGESMYYRRPVTEVIFNALPWTLLIVTVSLFLSFTVGCFIGIYIALKRNKVLDAVLIMYSSIFGAIPDYIIGFILIFILSIELGLLPARGAYGADVIRGFNMPFILSVIKHSILPITAYFITQVGGWMMSMKASCTSVLGEDYIQYARARGLSEKRIITSYVGRNAILPMVTSLAISFGFMFGGAPLVENLFIYPGLGYYLGQATGQRDFTMMQGMFFLIILMVTTASLVAELLYSVLNPRLRVKG